MTSRDFLSAESANTDRIVLYREGLFWKAYERSAFALCSQVRPLKPTHKTLKTLGGGDLISVGFPVSAEAATIGRLSVLERSDDRLTLAAPRGIIEQEFRIWKTSVPVKPQSVRPKAPGSGPGDNPTGTVATASDCRVGAGDSAVGASATLAPAARSSARAVDSAAGSLTPGSGAEFSFQGSWLQRLVRMFSSRSVVSTDSATVSAERRIAESLKDFNLADKTPMECMLFISELKNMLVNR